MMKNLELFELFIINLPKFRKIHIVDILTQSQLTVTRFFPSFSWKERQKLATNAKVAIKNEQFVSSYTFICLYAQF